MSSASTSTSKLYSFGCAIDGKLANGRIDGYEAYPYHIEQVDGHSKFNYIGCGHYHSMFISNDSKLYSWGWTSFVGGEKGKKETNYKATYPTRVDNNDNDLLVKSVAGGRRHTLIVDTQGQLYSFGVGSEYQLGHGDKLHQVTPTKVTALNGVNIVKAVCGWGHSMALSSNGEVYVWGWAKDGQLGLGGRQSDDLAPVTLPVVLDQLRQHRIVDIYAGSDYSMALTDRGELLSWGSGEFGQLGHGDNQHQYRPKMIDGLTITTKDSTRRVSCGFSHTLIIDDNGALVSFGWNGSGQLGLGDTDNRYTPTSLPPDNHFGNDTLVQVAAGRAHSAALTKSGHLYTWGSMAKGKLVEEFSEDNNLESEEIAEQVACGFDHTLVMIK
ncbi:hypothetical protein SAMD00019534_051890 [Acytostelium subglobosum LB1]|uniref:hypothetical protein n=1 Tax=Acytostelium subglobosum LB1 TaxID=1410327 RepID=UPI000644A4E0|nr:hypothetical protein SAMD00019534_051890 [Acytostelium subglobosum LB1]GAM22014.1 hypothetical protein SAMD00019534_051890 [Acytostelium subglobosum LB1]|eukprot:XP_012755114.1 hypothetical protein SAMD00019534_051890 [Acytostelium subglobosum LB1]